MRCQLFRARLARGPQTEAGSGRHSAMPRHAQTCPACARELQAERDLRHALAAVSAPELPQGFEARVLERARAPRVEHRVGTVRLAAAGLATACAAVILAVWLWPAAAPSSASATPRVALTLRQPKQVGFVFHVRHRIRNALIVVNLPQGVTIYGHREHRLSWRVNLNQGDNLLTLPLVASTPGEGLVSAEVNAEGSTSPLARAVLVTHTVGGEGTRDAVPVATSGA